jgi:hypothetical protein
MLRCFSPAATFSAAPEACACGALSPQAREGMQAGLQQAVDAEPIASVRRAECAAIASIARTAVPAGQWPGLLPWLHGCTRSPNEAQRETALVLLSSLTDTIGERAPRCPSPDGLMPDGGSKPMCLWIRCVVEFLMHSRDLLQSRS